MDERLLSKAKISERDLLTAHITAAHTCYSSPDGSLTRGTWVAMCCAWGMGLCPAVILEAGRIRERLVHMATVGGWSGDPDPDATYMLVWLLLAPCCWCFRFPVRAGSPSSESKLRTSRSTLPGGLLTAAVALAAVIATGHRPVSSSADAQTFADRTPAIHDEFSYLLQAQTFLAGRWFWDSPAQAPELFHQMHVLNDGRFASRYFPGTGAWIAPWLAIGKPIWGLWLAHVLVAVGMLLIGTRLAGTGAGLTAGLLTALSPGMVLFGNLFLAHLPALAGLTLFLWAFLRLMDQPRWSEGLLAGTGLAFAMLCRPLTAGAIGLPFGLWWMSQGIRSRRPAATPTPLQWLGTSAALAGPLLVGFLIIGCQNATVTGSVWTTPYSRYNELYTPYQRYGFHNRSRETSPLPPTVLKDYNNWARDLDGKLAIQNLFTRFRASLEWTLGIVPLTMGLVFACGTFLRQPRRVQLLVCAIVSLHAWHVPYWLDGILHYHYVFESGPLLLLILAAVSTEPLRAAMRQRRFLFPVWWYGLLLLAVSVNHLQVGLGTTTPRIHRGMSSVTHAADRYRRFEETLREANIRTPALVLVQTSLGDLHVEYVRNMPPFDDEILVGIDRPEFYDHAQVPALFPERTVYLYHTDRAQLTRLDSGPEDVSPSNPGVR